MGGPWLLARVTPGSILGTFSLTHLVNGPLAGPSCDIGMNQSSRSFAWLVPTKIEALKSAKNRMIGKRFVMFWGLVKSVGFLRFGRKKIGANRCSLIKTRGCRNSRSGSIIVYL